MPEVPTIGDIEAYTFHEREWESYEQLRDSFTHTVPEQFNITRYCVDRWAPDKGRVALFSDGDNVDQQTYTYWQLRTITNALANYFESRGINRGDRIGVNLPQKPEAAMAHLAAWKMGAVSVPLSSLFGPEALSYRLDDAGAKAVVTDEMSIEAIREVKDDLDALETILTVGDVATMNGEVDFWTAQTGVSTSYDTVDTPADANAVILYTSGTTGPPKGVLHAHRSVLGHLSGIYSGYYNLQVHSSDVLWTPAEWAWIATVLGTLSTTLYNGLPLVAYRMAGGFDPITAFEIIENYGVSISFLPPTALRMMMQHTDTARRHNLDSIRVVYSGGESLGEDVADWANEVFAGAAVHEVYGQTEANVIVDECTTLFPRRESSMGKPCPGRTMKLLDPDETAPTEVEPGEVGEISLRVEDDPVVFKEYWNKPAKTAETIQNGWLRTGDLGREDDDGYVYFVSRKDDVIISAGYRIGPDEIEDAIASHPAVLNAGVIGIPDGERGEIPKAFVVLANGEQPTEELARELQSFVKERLAKYEYPREIEFIDELPMTVTGKTRRTALRDREGID